MIPRPLLLVSVFFTPVPDVTAAVQSSSANIIILEREDIAPNPARTIVELINSLPGMSTTDGGSLSIGGFNASEILVTLDGRPINDQTIKAKYIKWAEVDYTSIERIEIHKISSRCAGGEVKILTRRNAAKVGGRIDALRGSPGQEGVKGSCQLTRNDLLLSLSHNYRAEGEHHNNNNDGKNSNSTVQIGIKKKFSLNGSFSYFAEEEGSSVWNYDTPEKTRPPKSDDYRPDPTPARTRGELSSFGGTANFEYRSLQCGLFVNDFSKENYQTGEKHDSLDHIVYTVDPVTQEVSTIPYRGRNGVDVVEYGGQAGITVGAFDFGLRGVRYAVDFSKTDSRTAAVTAGDEHEYLVDLSGIWRWRGLTISSNAYYHKEYGFDLFPKIAFSRRVGKLTFDATFTATKTYPSYFERYFSTSSTRANEDLKPQTNLYFTLKGSGNHDIGRNRLKWQFAPFFNKAFSQSYTRTVFTTDDAGDLLINPETGLTIVDYKQYDNLESSYWAGSDFIVDYSFDGRAGFEGCLTARYTRDEDHGTSFSYTAPFRFKGSCFCKPFDFLYLQLWATWYSNRYADQDETYLMLWYYYLDFKATVTLNRHAELYVEVKNLTDFNYYVYRGYPGNSRRWWIGGQVTF